MYSTRTEQATVGASRFGKYIPRVISVDQKQVGTLIKIVTSVSGIQSEFFI